MPTATTRPTALVAPVRPLRLALDVGNTTGKLAFATGRAPRLRTMRARALARLAREIAAAKARPRKPASGSRPTRPS